VTLGPRTLQIRRGFWRLGTTKLFELDRVRNFRVKMISLQGFDFETIHFDYDLELGVIQGMGQHLDADEARRLASGIDQWKKALQHP